MPFDAMPQDDAERTERLLELCRVIEGVAEDAFDLRDWNQNGVCRTVACAVGWAMKDEWFRQQGLGRDGKSPSFGADKGLIPRLSILEDKASTTFRVIFWISLFQFDAANALHRGISVAQNPSSNQHELMVYNTCEDFSNLHVRAKRNLMSEEPTLGTDPETKKHE